MLTVCLKILRAHSLGCFAPGWANICQHFSCLAEAEFQWTLNVPTARRRSGHWPAISNLSICHPCHPLSSNLWPRLLYLNSFSFSTHYPKGFSSMDQGQHKRSHWLLVWAESHIRGLQLQVSSVSGGRISFREDMNKRRAQDWVKYEKQVEKCTLQTCVCFHALIISDPLDRSKISGLPSITITILQG